MLIHVDISIQYQYQFMLIYCQYLGVEDKSISKDLPYFTCGGYIDIDVSSILPKISIYRPSIWIPTLLVFLGECPIHLVFC